MKIRLKFLNKSVRYSILSTLLMFMISSLVFSQLSFQERNSFLVENTNFKKSKNLFNKEIQFGLNSGVVLLWGDGSDRFSNPLTKSLDKFERGYHFGLSGGYRHVSYIMTEFSFGFGNSKGVRIFHGNSAMQNVRFENNFFDIELKSVFYPLQLILGENLRFFDPYLFAGIGIATYRSVQYALLTDAVIQFYGFKSSNLEKSMPEVVFSIPYGLGLDLRVTKNITANFSHTYVYLFSDTFDAFEGNQGKVKDIYSKTSIGVKYNLNPMKKATKKGIETFIIDEPFNPSPLEVKLPDAEEVEPKVIEYNVKVKRDKK